jgi:NADH-quinone oxidoreductase subunit L
MLAPLSILALGSLFAGFLGYSLFLGPDPMWGKAIFLSVDNAALFHNPPHVPFVLELVPLALALSGIGWAFYKYHVKTAPEDFFPSQRGSFYLFFAHKWYIDELYDRLFTQPLWKVGYFFWQKGDVQGIDRMGPGGMVMVVGWLSKQVSFLQTGYLYHYAFAMILGLVGGLFALIRYLYL